MRAGLLGFRHLCLDGSDRDDADDVLGGATAREVVDGLGDALEERSVCLGLSEALNELVADVPGVEVREDEDVRLAGDSRAWGLELRHLRDECCVELQLAVAVELGGLLGETDATVRGIA